MSIRRRAIKVRVERDRERKRQFDAQTASLNELVRRVNADPEGFRAEVKAAIEALPHRQPESQKP